MGDSPETESVAPSDMDADQLYAMLTENPSRESFTEAEIRHYMARDPDEGLDSFAGLRPNMEVRVRRPGRGIVTAVMVRPEGSDMCTCVEYDDAGDVARRYQAHRHDIVEVVGKYKF